jgi:hypothetical protein
MVNRPQDVLSIAIKALRASDQRNHDFKTEPVDDLIDVLQASKNGKNGLKSPTRGTFHEWLIEYRKRLAKVLQEETRNTNRG